MRFPFYVCMAMAGPYVLATCGHRHPTRRAARKCFNATQDKGHDQLEHVGSWRKSYHSVLTMVVEVRP